MKHLRELCEHLKKIDGKNYPAYKDIKGSYETNNGFTVRIDHVQGDPFAAPSKVRVWSDIDNNGLKKELYSTASRRYGTAHYLAELFSEEARKNSRVRGSGKSGKIIMKKPGQEMLPRTSVQIFSDGNIEARFSVGFPAKGRRIAGLAAKDIFSKDIPFIVDSSLHNFNTEKALEYAEVYEDADYLRNALEEYGLISFVADQSMLPRKSGVDSSPMEDGVPFASPDSMRVTLSLPNKGKVSGMGIQKGITLVVGGGFHGKSSLLNAIELGVYNHKPNDGREYVITVDDAVKMRAEDGRSVEGCGLTPFIKNLPLGKDTTFFSTPNASGSTSQAANILEAIEIGTRLLLIDEDTTATNFMIRDHRMQKLINKNKEPITPYLDKVRQLSNEYDISTVLVVGGSGEYFDVADTVVAMDNYKPYEVTGKAKKIANEFAKERADEGGKQFGDIHTRIPKKKSLNPKKGKRDVKVKTTNNSISFGYEDIDLSYVEQIVGDDQVAAIADALVYMRTLMDESKSISELVDIIMQQIEQGGIDVISRSPRGDYAGFRAHELAAALNRIRTLSVVQRKD